ncbi:MULTISPECIES: phosphoribosylaminoimidazolesuccinocarboxamide synthase [Priestia]|jgi:phosphoribosylaminoimidazole-succinocarboxamide synthase|uniref:Phosphoribosylaminoimidazole-succinocarboxamide synthase n=1 Tax=Priestia megaterium TaxID=1404 RepID=A0AAE5P413_PRIMG|nr:MULTISPECIES: phosphoribosylaminoimidazolesuccinocarboxamide synthase [Priestia]MBZ5482056.1 phosphoribosylaminoimidazolesuccinocarboxamide synthase [Bacillus sp. T_4]MDH6656775.1 phosphoribosylaminoimidazole-succinocarboxamide synthase [Bacillus sp. PvP124]MBV6737443.1 phosphoribosylaminoimidazolesuccinocarboxamide synthase [Priestia megaterium]MBW0933197.1 phosphoribosylaminoimidazolesuccinocarboxamide synthase [Priestia megaterium]MCI4619491.1 phosphoribosylaminoimidazolesuccinocarboxami
MEKQELLYEGKAKKIYATDEQDVLWVAYKNEATAFNGQKKAEISGKAQLNNQISSLLFSMLHEQGITTHFVKQLSDHEQAVKKVDIVPLEVVVRNATAGSLAKRIGVEEGIRFEQPIVELYYKDDALGDPLILAEHAIFLKAATQEEIDSLKAQALQINEILSKFFKDKDIFLVDFKLEFGRTSQGDIILADEISPDTCRFWDVHTNEKLDKDVFRRDLGGLTEAYEKILQRIGG